MKKVITAAVVVLVVIFGIIAVKNNWIFKDTGQNQQNYLNDAGGETARENVTYYQEGEVTIDRKQISDMGTPVVAEFYRMKETVPYKTEEINVTDCYYSRTLGEEYTFKPYHVARYGDGIFEDNGNLIKDYYYLYVDFTVTNIGPAQVAFLPSCLEYIGIDAKGVAVYDMSLDNELIYIFDPAQVFGRGGILENFATDSQIRFSLVYLVPDEMIEANEICIVANEGDTGTSAISGEHKRFIRLNLEGRAR